MTAVEELLLLEDGHCLRYQALEVCQMAGAHEKLDFHATSMETLRQMGRGQYRNHPDATLAVKPPSPPPQPDYPALHPSGPTRTIAMAWRKSSELTEFSKNWPNCFPQSTRTLKP